MRYFFFLFIGKETISFERFFDDAKSVMAELSNRNYDKAIVINENKEIVF